MTRPRARHIKVWLTEEEGAAIAALAASANLSLSGYLRAGGLNKKVRSAFDVHAVTELSKVNGELGRLAELLKLLLDEGNKGAYAKGRDIEYMIKEFRNIQKMSHEIMGRMTRR